MAILKDLIVQGSSRHIGTSYFGYMYGFLIGYVDGDISGNAATANNAATADKWKTARSIKIGNTSHDLDGSANVTWTLSEIGAQASGNYVTKEELNAKAYLQKAGGTMTGTLTLLANQYEDTNASGALNANNSDLYNVNSIKFADSSGGPSEGLQWKRSSGTNVDSIWVLNGEAYITPNRAFGSTGTNYKFLHEGNLLNHQFTNSTYGVLLSYAPPTKTSSQLGLKATNTVNRYYGVVATNNGYAYVNVPWTDTDIHVTDIQYSDNQDGILTKIIQNDQHFDCNDIIPSMTNDTWGVAKTMYKDPEGLTPRDINPEPGDIRIERWYGVQKLPKSGNLVVYVPWTDTVPNQTNHYTPSSFVSEYKQFGKYSSTAVTYAITGMSYSFDSKRHIGVISYAYAPVSSVNTYVRSAYFKNENTGYGLYIAYANNDTSNIGYVKTTLPKMTNTSYGVAKLGTSTILTINTANKVYPVGITADGKLGVDVPWSGGTGGDGNNYVNDASFSDSTDGTGKTLTLAREGLSNLTASLPKASNSTYGVVKVARTATITKSDCSSESSTTQRYLVSMTKDGFAYVGVPLASANTYIRSAYFKDESTSYTLYIAYANNATSNIGYVKTSIVKRDATNKFLSSLPNWTATPTDNTYLIRQDTGGGNEFGRVKFSTLKPWIHAYIGTLSYVTKADLSAQGYVNIQMTTTNYGYAKLGDSNILTIGNKIYGVGITADGQLAVNVPWVGGGTGADGNDFVDGAEFTDDTNGNGKLLTLSVGTQNDVTANINVMSNSSYGVAKSYYGRLTEKILVNDATTITGKWVGTNITEDGKIVTNIGNVASGNGKIFYGTCESAATSTTKEVNCAEFTTDDLKDGTVIYVKFDATNSGSVSSLKLKVGNTSAYPIKKIMNGAWGNLSSTADLRAGSIMQFTYTKASSSNAYWQILSTDYNANTNSYVRRTYFTNQNTGLQLNITYGTSTSTSSYIRDLDGNRPIIPIASNSSYGVIKAKAVSSTTVTENIYASNTSNRYGVVISGDGIAYVAVPWTDNHCDSSGHYSPSFNNQSVSGTRDDSLDSKMHIVTGVTYTKDSKGHIGSISYSYAGLSLSYFVTSETNPVDSTTLVRVKTIITSQTVGDEPAALYIII